ncbi:PKD domain-containing protein [uncultured Pontibacter sp.]|uniref:Ig-like domain-containing protein n=1 Tax=uncultured Pontibacter sp. TaxID=453356 RepID=UPI002622AB9B|nr:PKD domain-containing protein [uncultured Pontibacter sp.]
MGIRLLRNRIVLSITLAFLSLFSVFALTRDFSGFSLNVFAADPNCKPVITPAGPLEVCEGSSIKLTSSLKGTAYIWKKGGNIVYEGPNDFYNVSESGSYTVEANGVADCTGSTAPSEAVTVTVNPKPAVDFSFTNDEACSGTSIKFTNNSTGSGLSYSWDFGDGSPIVNSHSPAHKFNVVGSGTKDFSVRLTVTSDKGCSSSIARVVRVKEAPSAELKDTDVSSWQTPFVRCSENASTVNYTFNVSNQSTTSANNSGYSIDWGDGTSVESFGANFTTASHTYTQLGAFNIVLTVTGSNGCVSRKTYPAYIGSNPSLTVGQPGNTVGCTPQAYTFPISDVSGNTPATKYTFQFDDGTPAYEFTQDNIPASLTHEFNKSSCGNTKNAFTLTARAENPCGETTVTVSSIKIGSKPKANYSSSPLKISYCPQDIISFTNTTIRGNTIVGNNCVSVTDYKWEIEPATGWGWQTGNSTSENISLKFTATGTYKVKLTATSGCGSDEIVKEIKVIAPPQAAFTTNPASGEGCANLTVTPTNTSVGENLSYTWSVSPNSGYTLTNGSLTSTNPVFSFTQAGNYTITLVATNSCGTSTATKSIIVKEKPIVQLPSDKTYCGPQTIKFSTVNTSHTPAYNAKNGTISAYTWSVGGGATFVGGTSSSSQYPEINFPVAGTYTVTVQATNECGISTPESQIITINELPAAPSVTPVTVCKGSSATLTVSGSGPTYKWYTAATGGTAIYTGTALTVNPANTTTTYYVEAVSAQNCISASRTPVTLTVTEPVANNIIGSSASICENSTAPTLTGSTPTGGDGNYAYTWQSSTNGTSFVNAIGINNEKDYSPGVLTQKTWFRRIVKSGECIQDISAPVEITTIARPGAPTVAGTEICTGSSATLVAPVVTGITYKWYDVASGGFPLATANSFPTPQLSTTKTYYVEAVNSSNCASPARTAVTVKVNPVISNNTLSANQDICAGAVAATIVGAAPVGGNDGYTYRWYKSTTSASTGFTLVSGATEKDYAPGAVSVKTWYYREVLSGGCISQSAAVEIAVKTAPVAPTVANPTICKGNTASLTATAPGGSYTWYDAGGYKVAENTNVFTTPVLNATTSYYVETMVNGCTSATRTNVTVTVQQPITNNIVSGQQSLCKGMPAATLTGSNPSGGSGTYTYRWESSTTSATAGFSAASGTNTGSTYSPGTLTQTTWFRRVVISGQCANSESNVVEINITPAITANTITGEQTICEGTTPAKISGAEPSGGTGTFAYAWSFSTNGTTFTPMANATEREYTPGVLTETTWFRRDVTSGSCTVNSEAVKVTVEKNLGSNTITADQTICKGTSAAQLTGSIPSGGSGAYTYSWESSTDGTTYTAASGTINTQHYSPGAIEVTTWFRRKVSGGMCAPDYSNPVKVTVSEPIADNTIYTEQSICSGSIPGALVGSTPTGGDGAGNFSYRWESSTVSATNGFSPAAGTNTSKDYSPTAAHTQNTWYRRVVNSGACSGTSNAIAITVKPLPAAPSVSPKRICAGSTATLTAMGTATTYNWYATPTGGSVLETGSTFTTDPLSTTTTFYAESIQNDCASSTRTAVTVTVDNPVAGNTISGAQEICLGGTATGLPGSTPTGGDGSGSFTYLWESSADGATFSSAAGANSQKDYTPGALTADTWFRRKVTSGSCEPSYSNEVKITVTATIANNAISAAQTVCSGSLPQKLTGSLPQGGNGAFAYTWEQSTDGNSFSTAPGAVNGQDYSPEALTQTTWFRRKVTSGSCSVFSNLIKITVEVPIGNNTVASAQSICAGSVPTALTGTVPTGGAGAGTYSFLWESSTTSATEGFTATTGINNGATYAPAALTQTTWFRRKVTSGVCASDFSPAIEIAVTPVITMNSISSSQEICYNTIPAELTGPEPEGGNGTGSFTYVWESSTTSATSGFAAAAGANTGISYSPGALTQTTWFRRKAFSGACFLLSDAIKVTVKALPSAPTASGQTICAGSTATLMASGAADAFEWYADAVGGTALFTGESYKTDNLTATTTFYVQAVKDGCASATRTAVTVKVEQPIANNTIGQEQVICAGAIPSALTGSTPTNGSGSYTYTWLWSTDNVTFTAAPGANTGPGYAPPALAESTYFKRVVTSGVCQQSESNVVLVTANPSLTNNTIGQEQEICYGSIPTAFVGSTPAGGDGDYRYTWQVSTTSASAGFVNAPGANDGKDYAAGALTATTWYRRIVKSGGCEVVSSAIKVTVNPLPLAPTAAGQEICKGDMATLIVTDNGGIYTWYEEVTSENTLHTGTSFKTPALHSTTTYYVQVTDAKGCASPRTPVTVKVNPLLAGNSVTESQAICTGEKPADLVGSTPTGGNGVYVYLWEQSADNVTYVPATGVNNSRDYQTTALTQETWYRRRVLSGGCESISEPVQIIVNGVIANNSISSPQTICTGTVPAALSGTAPTGGDGTYSYRWEISTNGPTGIFTAAPGDNSKQGYEPGPLTKTTWYRRVVQSGGCADLSSAIEVKVNEKISNNAISADQIVCKGSDAATLNGSLPTGGNGTYTYVWEVSTLSATDGFTQATGTSNGQHYSPSTLTQTSWYRRRVISGPCEEHVSAVVKIMVNEAIADNAITGDQIICAGTAPTALTGSSPTGGSGAYVYLWEYSTESATSGFKPASGMNNGDQYQASALTQTTWFRRTVLSAPCPALVSNVIRVTVNPVITENTISGNQVICSGDVPALFAGSVPKGGDGVYAYLWEYSQDGVVYEAAPGKNNVQTYQATSLTQDTWYRRVVMSGNCTSVTSAVKITVNQPISDNLISEDQAVCMGGTPIGLSGSEPKGGNGNYTYEWQSSTKGPNSGFVAAVGVNNQESYDPGALTQTTWFRRMVTAGPCPPSYSNAVKISVNPPIANNKVGLAQAVCMGVTPAPLTGTKPTGGDGEYRYVWESSTKGPNTGFVPADGTNNEFTYAPEQITTTTWFRRAVYSGGCVHVSVAVQITVLPQVTGNSISTDQTVCVGSPAGALTGTVPSGGSGSYTYLWEASTDNMNFAPARGINNGVDYDPGTLTSTTWFRRIVSSAPCSEVVSNVVKVTVNMPIANNTVGSPQRICAGVTPASLQGTLPTGGSGTYVYLWEQSITSATAGFTAASGVNNTATYQPGPLSRTTWFRRVVSSLPCQNSVSAAIAITVDPLPAPPSGTGATICPGETATLKASSPVAGVVFEWYDQPTDGVMLHRGSTYTTDVLMTSTDFYVQTVNSFGCASASRVKVTAEVLASTADAGQDVIIIKGQNTGLHGKGGETYQWSPATGLSNPNIANPVATPQETTTYTLTVTTKAGCTYTDEVTVTVLPRIDPTNAITVNGDNINDWWEIRNIESYPDCHVKVFTRWGALVYESYGYKVPWDGTHNGKPLPMAAYYYVIDLGMGGEKPVSGSVTLIK